MYDVYMNPCWSPMKSPMGAASVALGSLLDARESGGAAEALAPAAARAAPASASPAHIAVRALRPGLLRPAPPETMLI